MGDLYTVLSEVKEQESLADLGRGFLISDQVRQPAGAAFGQRGNFQISGCFCSRFLKTSVLRHSYH